MITCDAKSMSQAQVFPETSRRCKGSPPWIRLPISRRTRRLSLCLLPILANLHYTNQPVSRGTSDAFSPIPSPQFGLHSGWWRKFFERDRALTALNSRAC
ncbi:hypothetical protein EVAR_13741_1 [Eumeta japonica]|uniref:Uncharacterized protein n=1 Tax=Eumeta variegata TaxID=151549 RepID=A0A4C1UCZ4_EUMVA|nr:hypothetical protein EVAR_13741_1 [Eumeta japonica]